MVSAVVQLLALAAALSFGVIGVAIACTISMFALFVPALIYSGRPVGIGTKDVLQAVGPQTVAALAAVAVSFAVQLEFFVDWSPFARIVASGTICITTYLAIAVGVFRVTGPLQLAFSLLRDVRAIRLPAST